MSRFVSNGDLLILSFNSDCYKPVLGFRSRQYTDIEMIYAFSLWGMATNFVTESQLSQHNKIFSCSSQLAGQDFKPSILNRKFWTLPRSRKWASYIYFDTTRK
ncbi:hypothetical protein M758_3G160000 [Ceratodon purpureus]|nr:hypothetical protein M758_3G160000 [Ceratodon purpureus]